MDGIVRVVLSVVAFAMLGLYLFNPGGLAERFDLLAFGLLAFAGLPWLGAFLKSFKLGEFEAELQDARSAAAEAKQKADAASQAASEASETAVDAREMAEDASLVQQAPPTTSEQASLATLEDIAAEYVATRKAMSSGNARTARMTRLFAQMEQVAGQLLPETDLLGWLESENEGQRLAALAWLRGDPARALPSALLSAIESARQPFVQYWALRVLSMRVDLKGRADFAINDVTRLEALQHQMKRGTDRYIQVRRIREKLDRA